MHFLYINAIKTKIPSSSEIGDYKGEFEKKILLIFIS